MKVDRCVCVDVRFEALRPMAAALGNSFCRLRDATGCAKGCGACEPYIRLMLETGKTEFPLLGDEEATQIRLRGRAQDLEEGAGHG